MVAHRDQLQGPADHAAKLLLLALLENLILVL
jgi:hypothetical protein